MLSFHQKDSLLNLLTPISSEQGFVFYLLQTPCLGLEYIVYENNRNADIQTSIQHTFTSTCSGSYQFALQSDYTNVDDDVVIDQVQITAVKY